MSLEPVHYIWFARGYCLAFLTVLPNKSQKIWIHFELKWNKTGKKKSSKTNQKTKEQIVRAAGDFHFRHEISYL